MEKLPKPSQELCSVSTLPGQSQEDIRLKIMTYPVFLSAAWLLLIQVVFILALQIVFFLHSQLIQVTPDLGLL